MQSVLLAMACHGCGTSNGAQSALTLHHTFQDPFSVCALFAILVNDHASTVDESTVVMS